MIFEVKFVEPAEGTTITELMTEDKITKLQANDGMIISVEPSKGSQARINAEIEAYKRGDVNAFGDANRR